MPAIGAMTDCAAKAYAEMSNACARTSGTREFARVGGRAVCGTCYCHTPLASPGIGRPRSECRAHRVNDGGAEEAEGDEPVVLCDGGMAQQLLPTGTAERRERVQYHTDVPELVALPLFSKALLQAHVLTSVAAIFEAFLGGIHHARERLEESIPLVCHHV